MLEGGEVPLKEPGRGWLMYEDLAWLEPIITSPEEAAGEAEVYCDRIKKMSNAPRTLLHLGCGAGMHDYTFKKHFRVTGLDISSGMLEEARKINPGMEYLKGDMRSARLGRRFDAVAVPDSVGYMKNEDELKQALATAGAHLGRGGVLLIVTVVSEDFRENNFIYTGRGEGVSVTVFENNAAVSESLYEAAVVYLLRREEGLEVYAEKHRLGLFRAGRWLELFSETGFESPRAEKMPHLYDRYTAEEGSYVLTMFTCVKT